MIVSESVFLVILLYVAEINKYDRNILLYVILYRFRLMRFNMVNTTGVGTETHIAKIVTVSKCV